ncbi:MAG: glycoside hydrolase family 125 protein [Planctomycetes bacterium]|nr:glycoside hydrolase family 125 protein [Planctomycetota bacterium]
MFESKRPAPEKRCFQSKAVEEAIASIKSSIADEELAWMFENCFPNTLDTTVEVGEVDGRPDTFVITGDIHAMWLRDSTAQVWPYIRYASEDEELRQVILGAIYRQAACVRIDPYANAYNKEATGGHWESDLTDMLPELHERKWEIDSLCYVIRLAYGYWQCTGKLDFMDSDWLETARLIVSTFREQQRMDGNGQYKFQRKTITSADTLPLGGYGYPVKPCGLICSAFRPSDDACVVHYLVPSNFVAVVSLRQLAEMLDAADMGRDLAEEAVAMANQVEAALHDYAVVKHDTHGAIFAYEIDGFGGQLLMDDSNIPSLLALPYLGCCDRDNELYESTRSFVLSEDNPFYFKGKYGEGIGGPHVGMDFFWPMSVIMRALTSEDEEEVAACIKQLKATHAGTGLMHEGVNVNNPENFTRKWFAWVNTLFGELIVTVSEKFPTLLERQF